MDNVSAFKKPGEEYSHTFSLIAPKSERYLPFLSLTTYFGPGGGALQRSSWNTADWYNQTETGHVHGAVTSSQLTPIRADESQTQKQANLILRIQKPFSEIQQVKVNVTHNWPKETSGNSEGARRYGQVYITI